MIDAPLPACATGPRVAREAFIAASVDYLRESFGTSTGFDGGSVAYSEGWVSLDDNGCPLADWSALVYVVDIAPSLVPVEMRATHDRVAAVWTLGGQQLIAFLPHDAPLGGDPVAPWPYALIPDSVVAVVAGNANPPAVEQLVADLRAEFPAIDVSYLDAIGTVSLAYSFSSLGPVGPGATIATMDAATERLRTSGLVDAIEWSSIVFRLPNEFWPAVVAPDAELAPECMRVHTNELLEMFTTEPALGGPLGPGPIPQLPTCS